MTRDQVFVLLLLGFAAIVGGVVWMFGPLALIASGLVFAVFALVVNLKE